MKKLKYYKIHDDVVDPYFATKGSACFDICAYITETPITVYKMENLKEKIIPENSRLFKEQELQISLSPADRVLVPTGLFFDIPDGYSVRLHTRSSISLKRGLIMPNGEGIIDSDYYNETFIMLYNSSADNIYIENGERIAQGELIKSLDFSLESVIIPPKQITNRVGGFGSTGVK
jgi:dUTP pyrophosphatase